MQVDRAEALGEPADERREERMSVGALTLSLQEPSEARRGPQLMRARVTLTGDVERAPQASLRPCGVGAVLCQKKDAFEPACSQQATA